MRTSDALFGFLAGALIMTIVAIGIRDVGRDECEKNLLRSEKCVQKWIPETETAQRAAQAAQGGEHHG